MKITTLTAIALILGTSCAFAADTAPTAHPSSSGRPAAVLSDSQCNQVWQQALNTAQKNQSGANQNGNELNSLTKLDASKYISNFAMVDKNSDGTISKTEFQAGCKNGWIQTASKGSTNMQDQNNNMNKSGG
jgi:hypothetical protein